MTTSFICSVCGKEHRGPLMDLAYTHPADYHKIPPRERAERIDFNDDFCVIDKSEYYIRGVLLLRVKETQGTFRWGLWAEVSEEEFFYYRAHWNIPNTEDVLPLSGRLSGGVGPYPDSDQLPVTVNLQPNNQRPLFYVVSSEHPLGYDQRNGITLHDVMTFTAPVLNDAKATVQQ
jgi:hypothetical protein